jgi:choline/glycine/proline betaine transport protein
LRHSEDTDPIKTDSRRWIIHPIVFNTSAAIICGFVILAMIFTDQMGEAAGEVQSYIVTYFGWFYILSVAAILIFVVWLACTRFGNIRLGSNDSRPEYNTFTWFAMLFSAGMGIGLLFYSVAEPILHFASPPTGEGGTVEAAERSMNLTFFHWGLHAWGIYTLVGLSLAYFSFRRGLPLTIRSTLYPLIGERIHGPIGNFVDIAAVVGTLFGVATSLGLGVMQINAGLHHVLGVPEGIAVQLLLIAGITTLATISVVSGLNVGIRRLSELNITVGILLCLFLFIAGPSVFLLKMFVQSLGTYLQHLPETTLWTATFQETEWQSSWTIFYWGWWIAWSPFVGMFIARVSKGRTIRQFVFGVLLCPTGATFVWLSIFGGTALYEELYGGGGISEQVSQNLPVALFALLERFPFGGIASLLATGVVITFFVTSSDSGSLVIDIITSGGHPDPPVRQRIFWAVLEGVVAGVLLFMGGTAALSALQTASITMGLPFCGVILVMAWGLLRGLREEKLLVPAPVYQVPESKHAPPPALTATDSVQSIDQS